MRGRDDARLATLYALSRARFGHRRWWPARTRLEVIVGAILAQNTAWKNVERAIGNLRRARCLSLAALRAEPEPQLAELIRPSGHFNQKARKLKSFVAFMDAHYGGRIARMRRAPTERLRNELLSVHGIGPETADSILLYAIEKPVFVVDAYTRRVIERHRIVRSGLGYEEIRAYFERRLPRDVAHWNDFHAQIVAVGHHHCGPTPRCDGCPLEPLIPRQGIRRTRRR